MTRAISFCTANCIVTGKPATIWTGHVRASCYGPIRSDGKMPQPMISATAGFVDNETMLKTKSDDFGCFGDWKPDDGLLIDNLRPYERVLTAVNAHDELVAALQDATSALTNLSNGTMFSVPKAMAARKKARAVLAKVKP